MLDNFCITYTGSLSKAKGLPAFVESAKYLKDTPNIKLVMLATAAKRKFTSNNQQERPS